MKNHKGTNMKSMIALKISKKKPQELVKEADNSILDELIGNCEEKMSSKFKKPDLIVENSEGPEDPMHEKEPGELDEDKKALLIELYKSLKGA